MNELDLPPRRTLPPEVRGRIRGAVDTGAEVPRRHRSRLRGPFEAAPARRFTLSSPLTVAAGVAVLAVGAVLVVQSTGDSGDSVATPPSSTSIAPPTNAAGTPMTRADLGRMLDRCHEALVSEGVADTPPREQWQPRVWIDMVPDGSFVIAASAGDKPVICSISGTHVTVTNPNTTPAYAPGTGTGVLLALPNGVLGGVIDPSWPQLGLVLRDNGRVRTTTPAKQDHGFFLMQSPYVAGAKVAAYPVAGDEPPAVTFPLPVEDAPEPVVFVAIPDERAALIECLSEGGHDPTGWVPSQSVDTDDGRLLLASKGDELAACYDTGQSGYTFTAVTAQAGPAALVRGLPTVALPRQPIAGHTTPNAVIAELYFGDNVVRAPVINSLFLLVPPSDTRLTKVRLLDGNGTLLWDGPLR